MLDHATIEEEQIAERYVMGKLPPDEATLFEEHYLSCPECLDRLELAESMERGFKRAAGQEAARVAATRQLALVAWLARLGRSRQLAALLAAVVVVALVPGGLALREIGRTKGELTEARRALEEEKERSAAGSKSSLEAGRLREELEASRHKLEEEQKARAAADEKLRAAQQPQGNVPILFLDVERGGGEPTHQVSLSRSPGSIVLSWVLDPPHPPAYRAVLRDARGHEIRRVEGLRADRQDTLALSLPSSLLAPGDYTLEVTGGTAPVRLTFRALP